MTENERIGLENRQRDAITNYIDILGRTVRIKIDRPIGSVHPKHPNLIYPINYGFVENLMGGDGEEQDVYLLGVNEKVMEYKAKVIAVVHRLNDNEDKWVACPANMDFSREEIFKNIYFQEQFYRSEIFMK